MLLFFFTYYQLFMSVLALVPTYLLRRTYAFRIYDFLLLAT